MPKPVRDRFDDAPRTTGRVGAHRAENPGSNGWIVLLWSAVAVLVLVVVGIFASLMVMGRIALGPDEPAEVAPEPAATGVVDMSYSVMILNSTPEEGIDTRLRDDLINEGWDADTVFAFDGDSQDFPETTVYYIDDADAAAAEGLADLIGGAAVEQSDFYAELNVTDGPQLTIVLGLDRVTATSSPDDAPAS